MVLEKSTEYKNDEKRYAGTIMIPGTYNFILLLPRERTRREQHFFFILGKHLVKFEAQIMEKSDTTTSS